MSMRVPMTPTGEEKLKNTLSEITQQIARVADKIAHARGFGDLKENAEYSSAKQEQALLMRQSQALSEKLRFRHVVNPRKLDKTGKVVFGTTVHLENTENKEMMVVQIVGEDEADIKLGKISFNSPIAQGVIGKMAGDDVKITTLEGMKSFKIVQVEYL